MKNANVLSTRNQIAYPCLSRHSGSFAIYRVPGRENGARIRKQTASSLTSRRCVSYGIELFETLSVEENMRRKQRIRKQTEENNIAKRRSYGAERLRLLV